MVYSPFCIDLTLSLFLTPAISDMDTEHILTQGKLLNYFVNVVYQNKKSKCSSDL